LLFQLSLSLLVGLSLLSHPLLALLQLLAL
jgi:hypothetical protein